MPFLLLFFGNQLSTLFKWFWLHIAEPIRLYKSSWVSKLWLFWSYDRCWCSKWNDKNMEYWGGERYEPVLTVHWKLELQLCHAIISVSIEYVHNVVVRTFTGHRSNCASLDFHPFGEFLASGSSDTNMKIWDTRKKRCIHTYKGHTRRIDVLKFTPDGRWIVSGGADNSVKVQFRACPLIIMQIVWRS